MPATSEPTAGPDWPATPESPHALIERRGHVLIVTMNRPHARNALSGEMMALMRQAWDEVDADPGHQGRGADRRGRVRSAPGADLKAMTAAPPGDSFRHGGMDLSVIDALLKGRRLAKPLIAAVEGAAVAGGTRDPAGDRHQDRGRERQVRRLRGALGPVPARRLGGQAGAADPLHDRGRPAADRPAHHRRGGAADRSDRSGRAGRPGAGQGT